MEDVTITWIHCIWDTSIMGTSMTFILYYGKIVDVSSDNKLVFENFYTLVDVR